MRTSLLAMTLVAAAPLSAQGKLELPALFSDHMVLQREVRAPNPEGANLYNKEGLSSLFSPSLQHQL